MVTTLDDPGRWSVRTCSHAGAWEPDQNYDDLRRDVIIPRNLIVIVLPENDADWLSHSEEELILRHCGYWASLAGLSDTDNASSVTVRIPRTQQFNPDALHALMQAANQEG